MKINKVSDTAFLFQAAALFSDISYPLHGTNVFKIPNTNTKYIKINVFKYKYKIQYLVFQIRILCFIHKIHPKSAGILSFDKKVCENNCFFV